LKKIYKKIKKLLPTKNLTNSETFKGQVSFHLLLTFHNALTKVNNEKTKHRLFYRKKRKISQKVK